MRLDSITVIRIFFMGESKKTATTHLLSRQIAAIDCKVTSMASSILASIEKLRGRENYSSWKFSMENYLALEDLSACVTGNETDTKKNAKAKAAIGLSIDKTVIVHIKSAETAEEMWNNLKSTFEDSGAVRKVTLMRKIVNTKLESCASMELYVSEIISTSQKLVDVGFSVPDEWLAIFLLAGLTDDYLPMIMAMESSEKKLSSDSVKTKLLQETASGSTIEEKAFLAKNRGQVRRKRDLICYTCKRKGHKSVNCLEKTKKSNENDGSKVDKAGKNGNQVAFSAVFLSGDFNRNDWFIDSGATRHLSMRSDWMADKNMQVKSSIRAANNETMEVECSGNVDFTVSLNGKCSTVNIQNVLCIPKLTANLLSVSELTAKAKTVIFTSKGCEIRDTSTGKLLATATEVNGLYKLDGECVMAFAAMESATMDIWHRRMAHVNSSDLIRMKNGGVVGIEFAENYENVACVSCCKGKQSRRPFPKEGSRAKQLLEIIHGDLAGPMECPFIGGNRWCLVLVDDFSRRTFTYMLKHKNEAFDRFCSFKRLVENETDFRIKKFRSDNGTEFVGKNFTNFLDKHGIQHQTSVPYTPQQNGLAERTIRTLKEKARCMLQDANLHKKYWAEAINTAAYVKNHTISRVLDYKSPLEIWNGKVPDVRHFKVFGSMAMVMIPAEKRKAFDAKSMEMVFVGYSDDQKGYRLMDRKSNKVIVSRDVVFFENGNKCLNFDHFNENFKFFTDEEESVQREELSENHNENVVETNGVRHDQNNVAMVPQNRTEIEQVGGVRHGRNNVVDTNDLESSNEFADVEDDETFIQTQMEYASDDSRIVDTTLNESHEQVVRRSQRHGRPVERYEATHLVSGSVDNEPSTVNEAICGESSVSWKAAMEEEYRSLMQNKTWVLVDLPSGAKAIRNK